MWIQKTNTVVGLIGRFYSFIVIIYKKLGKIRIIMKLLVAKNVNLWYAGYNS